MTGTNGQFIEGMIEQIVIAQLCQRVGFPEVQVAKTRARATRITVGELTELR